MFKYNYIQDIYILNKLYQINFRFSKFTPTNFIHNNRSKIFLVFIKKKMRREKVYLGFHRPLGWGEENCSNNKRGCS